VIWLETHDDHVSFLDKTAFVVILKLVATHLRGQRILVVLMSIAILLFFRFDVILLTQLKREHLHLPAVNGLFFDLFRVSEWFSG